MKLKKVAIVGVGLIGGSVGKALIEKGLAEEVVAICRRESSLERALKEKAVSRGCVNDYTEAVGADLVLIATPVHTIKEALDSLAGVLKGGKTIVTDAGSTKMDIVDYADRFKDDFSFVGGHPLAGSEKMGVEYAKADLFQDSVCILTKSAVTLDDSIEKVKELWSAMGASVDVITTEKHDEVLAFTSHLPHAVAYALSGIQNKEFFKYMSTGFRDSTRIASSDPGLWGDIFMSNKDNMLKSIARFKELLDSLEEDIRMGREEDLKKKIEDCKKIRDEVS